MFGVSSQAARVAEAEGMGDFATQTMRCDVCQGHVGVERRVWSARCAWRRIWKTDVSRPKTASLDWLSHPLAIMTTSPRAPLVLQGQ